MSVLYDSIGEAYGDLRRPDPRIATAIDHALASASSVLNVGAGTGSYEPTGRRVVAVEPSRRMLAQRPLGAAPAVQASATALPISDKSFDASLAVLTVHHWPDRLRGLREMQRVARDTAVILTWDPSAPAFWLSEYFPEIQEIDRSIFPTLSELQDAMGSVESSVVRIPADCTDGFLGAYWRRPHSYLDPKIRSGMSTFSKLTGVETGLERLRDDLASGVWRRGHESLLQAETIDIGYRLVVAKAHG